jgi:predicted alpha/beta-hydrolase family hydrolase
MSGAAGTATWSVKVGSEQTTVAWDEASQPPPGEAEPPAGREAAPSGDVVFVCAHGAGGRMNDRSVLGVTGALRERGIATVRFNFLYRERGSGRPDSMPRLLECWDAVAVSVRERLQPRVLLLGGRSMGGRAASMFVADGAPADGLLLLAYPLHPPGQPDKLRVEHLPRIGVPVLCINGTRDPFCDRPLMERTLDGLGPNWRMSWLAGADHSFHVLKSSGRTDADVLEEVASVTHDWLTHQPVTGSPRRRNTRRAI